MTKNIQQFTIPQFIDVEDKIIGPITTRQFIILLVGFILGAIFYKIFDFSLFLTTAILDAIFCGIIAFARINGRPFHFFILNIIQTLKRAKLRVWNNTIGKTKEDYKEVENKIVVKKEVAAKRHAKSKLAELSLIVDTGGVYHGEKGEEGNIRGIN